MGVISVLIASIGRLKCRCSERCPKMQVTKFSRQTVSLLKTDEFVDGPTSQLYSKISLRCS